MKDQGYDLIPRGVVFFLSFALLAPSVALAQPAVVSRNVNLRLDPSTSQPRIRYCQLELIVARLDARPTKQTPEYSGFPLRGSRILSEIALKLTVPLGVTDALGRRT